MGVLILLVATVLGLALPGQGSAAVDATSPVMVTPAPTGLGGMFVPAGRPVAELEQNYVEEEFFISGEANLYTYNAIPVPGDIIVHPDMCTLFTCGPNGGVPYETRIIVRRPADPSDFNGTLVIEWLNSTAGFDTQPVWHSSAEYFAREGWIYVAVTNSATSIGHLVDGCLLLGLLPPGSCGTRYSTLSIPENGVAFEMVSQIANMLKTNAAPNPLFPDYADVDRLYHAGQSQQGGSMVTYATAFHFAANDGYFVQAAGGARPINFLTPCEDMGAPAYPACTPTLQGADRRVATNLPVPVYRHHMETDLSDGIGSTTRQTDTPTFRYYESAGTAHITVHADVESVPTGTLGIDNPIFLEELCEFEVNTGADGPIFASYLYNAMWDNMERQVQSSTVPPTGTLFATVTRCAGGGTNDGDPCTDDSECDSGECTDVIDRDADGNSIGGIRLPQMDLPTATYGPRNELTSDTSLFPPVFAALGNLFCVLSGTVERFDEATLATRYPDWTVFVSDFNQKIDDLIAARFLLPEDGDELRLSVEDSARQKCINSLNKNVTKVAKAQGKEVCGCIKDESKGKLDIEGITAEECLTADRKGKVDKAKQKTISKETSDCTVAPDFGVTDAATVNQAAMDKEIDLIHDILGPDLDAAVVASGSDAAKCQAEVAKRAKKCQDAKLKEFGKCKKAGLKDASVHDHLTLAACMGKDPKGKIAKACVEKLNDKIDGKCNGLDYATLFPGKCADEATLADFQACVERTVECRVCLALNEADGLSRNCDQFDDTLFNATCPGGSPSGAFLAPVDGVLD